MSNPMIGEAGNPFTNAKIVKIGADPHAYHATGSEYKRGDSQFIMSRSELLNFASCPHRWIRGYVRDADGPAVQWGEYIDALVTAPSRAKENWICAPESYEVQMMKCPQCGSLTDSQKCAKCKVQREAVTVKKEWDWNATSCREWREDRPGKTILKKQIFDDGERAISSLFGDSVVKEIVQCSQPQVFVMADYQDKETSVVVPCKMLLDLVPNIESEQWGQWLFDFKTSHSAAPGKWQRQVFEEGYHVQAAFFLDGYVAATGEDRNTFGHIVQENFWPFEHGKRLLSQEYLELGRLKYQDALKLYCQCLKSGQWLDYDTPGFYAGFSKTDLEAWMISK